jgi:hypothetical protein
VTASAEACRVVYRSALFELSVASVAAITTLAVAVAA